MLTGELDLHGKKITSAGIMTMVKAPKPPKPDAGGSGDAIAPTGDVSVPTVAIKKKRIPVPSQALG